MSRCSAIPTPFWEKLPDKELLGLRLCELRLSLRECRLYARVQQLYHELDRAGLAFRPHVWLSEEWFSPDGVPGFAIPFYLGHPRLAQLERSQMLECEGASHAECMKILRHEAGHALDNAFGLHRGPLWRSAFGKFAAPYPEHYNPAPASRDYVVHLNAWYAQSHPAEDFAETFAVWVADPRRKWERSYKGWAALAKLQAVDAMVSSVRGRTPPNQKRKRVQPLSACRTTLGQHYRRKREFYEVGMPTHYDADLLRLFAPDDVPEKIPQRQRAAIFLSRIRRGLCKAVSTTTGVHHYTVDQVLRRMIDRARHLNLVLIRDEQQIHDDMAVLLTAQVLNTALHGHARIPL
jgi:hypothetical protein